MSQIPTSEAHNFITNAYRDAMRNSNPRPSSRPRNNLRAVTPSEDEAQCAGAEGQESDDRRTRWHCFGKSQSLNNLLDKSKQIPELMVIVEIEDRSNSRGFEKKFVTILQGPKNSKNI